MAKFFSDIRVGYMFSNNGNTYVKQSSRTAKMLSNGRTFYFKQTDSAQSLVGTFVI